MSDDIKSLINKLTSKSKYILEQAAHCAVSYSNSTIEIEHFLKSALEENRSEIDTAAREFSLDRNEILKELNRAIEGFPKSASRTPTFSGQLVKAFREAWTVGSVEFELNNIGSGVILLACLSDLGLKAATSIASPTLYQIKQSDLYSKLGNIIKTSIESDLETDKIKNSGNVNDDGTSLSKYTVDLTSAAKSQSIDAVIGRDKEINELIDILLRRRQNNPILLGKPGVGKTALVEGFAIKLEVGAVPDALVGVRLLSLDLAQLGAGAGVRGEFEKRLKTLIKEVETATTPVILFIDEAHALIGSGGEAGKSDAANILKPALARGDLRIIAATTWGEYKKHFEKDAALVRRFQPVKVDEPSDEATKRLLASVAIKLEAHHKVRIEKSAIDSSVELSTRYIASRQQPDKAISLLDTACAKLASSAQKKPSIIQDLQNDLKIRELELGRLVTEKRLLVVDDESIALLETEIVKLQEDVITFENQSEVEREIIEKIVIIEKEAAKTDLSKEKTDDLLLLRNKLKNVQKGSPIRGVVVNEKTVASVVSSWTGIPLSNLTHRPEAKLSDLNDNLSEKIFGQEFACSVISDRMKVASAGLNVFFLVGPSGVGKTETAKAVADLLFLGKSEMITINMSEYQEAHSVAGLKGAPPGYVGYGEGGVLTEAVKRTPYNVILLDEFEKAHNDVRELFYQVFDEGRLDDSDGEKVDLRNTIIFVTSNSCSDFISSCYHSGEFSSSDMMTKLTDKLQQEFQPALLGRMTIVPYIPLSNKILKKIAIEQFTIIAERLESNFNVDVDLDNNLVDTIIRQAAKNENAGARGLIQVIELYILPKLSEIVVDLISRKSQISKLKIGMQNGGIHIETQ